MDAEDNSSLDVQPDLSPSSYTSSTALSVDRNVNATPQPFPDTLSHANTLHSALERLGEGQESSSMSASELHFTEQLSLPISFQEFSSLRSTQAHSE